MAAETLKPIGIPPTSLKRYVSFFYALNLRLPTEDTGDWHFKDYYFFLREVSDRKPTLAGELCNIDTNAALGSLGVRDMNEVLKAWRIIQDDEPVYVANHYRAIADLVYKAISKGKEPRTSNVRAINSWLDTQEQIGTLKDLYLLPLRGVLDGQAVRVFDKWIATLVFE